MALHFFINSFKFYLNYPANISNVVRIIPAKLFTTFSVVSRSLLIDCEIGLSGRGKRGNKIFGCNENYKNKYKNQEFLGR